MRKYTTEKKEKKQLPKVIFNAWFEETLQVQQMSLTDLLSFPLCLSSVYLSWWWKHPIGSSRMANSDPSQQICLSGPARHCVCMWVGVGVGVCVGVYVCVWDGVADEEVMD